MLSFRFLFQFQEEQIHFIRRCDCQRNNTPRKNTDAVWSVADGSLNSHFTLLFGWVHFCHLCRFSRYLSLPYHHALLDNLHHGLSYHQPYLFNFCVAYGVQGCRQQRHPNTTGEARWLGPPRPEMYHRCPMAVQDMPTWHRRPCVGGPLHWPSGRWGHPLCILIMSRKNNVLERDTKLQIHHCVHRTPIHRHCFANGSTNWSFLGCEYIRSEWGVYRISYTCDKHIIGICLGVSWRQVLNSSLWSFAESTSDFELLLTVANYEDSKGQYVVAANADIVGSLRGTTTKTCNYNVTNRDCVPTGRYNLKAGSIIDFSFGLSKRQDVRLYYAIIGSWENSMVEQGTVTTSRRLWYVSYIHPVNIVDLQACRSPAQFPYSYERFLFFFCFCHLDYLCASVTVWWCRIYIVEVVGCWS